MSDVPHPLCDEKVLYAVCGALTLKMIWKWMCTVRQVYFGKKPTRGE